jgi:hypothetical protein
MMNDSRKLLSVINQRIDEGVKHIEESLAAKGAKNFEEYCEMCGVIKGLLTARSYLSDLTYQLEKLDDE